MTISEKKTKIIQSFIDQILALPGGKIVTLADEQGEFIIDIKETGQIGYDDSHEPIFKLRLMRVLNYGGAAIIRQFLPLKTEKTMSNGKKMWIPKKNIYGVFFNEGQCFPLTKEEIRQAHCTDNKTGKQIPKEEDVFFCDFVWKNSEK